jgi:hypothetical protein
MVQQIGRKLSLAPNELTKLTGDLLEGLVESGNTTWNTSRIAFQKQSGTTADLLRPLFCTIDVNLAAGGVFRQPPDQIPPTFLADGEFDTFSARPANIGPATYNQALKNAGQRVVNAKGEQLFNEHHQALIDTAFPFQHPTRSFVDNNYLEQLQSQGLVTADFVQAVLGVDFTTPVFSTTRCDLLNFAPLLKDGDPDPTKVLSAENITAGFMAALMAAGPADGTGASDFLKTLAGTNPSPQSRVTAYLNACARRARQDPAGFMSDMMKLVSLRRNQFRALPLFEHPELLPVDDLNVSANTELTLDAATCALQ